MDVIWREVKEGDTSATIDYNGKLEVHNSNSSVQVIWNQNIVLKCDPGSGQATADSARGIGRLQLGPFSIEHGSSITATKAVNGKSTITVKMEIYVVGSEKVTRSSTFGVDAGIGWTPPKDEGGLNAHANLKWSVGWSSTFNGGYKWGLTDTQTYECKCDKAKANSK